MIDQELRAAAIEVLGCCRARGLKIATAESCTGGLVAAWLTEIPGSSDVVDRGFVTYSNDAKRTMLEVASAILEEHGAVSRATVEAMARGALVQSRAELLITAARVAYAAGAMPVGSLK